MIGAKALNTPKAVLHVIARAVTYGVDDSDGLVGSGSRIFCA